MEGGAHVVQSTHRHVAVVFVRLEPERSVVHVQHHHERVRQTTLQRHRWQIFDFAAVEDDLLCCKVPCYRLVITTKEVLIYKYLIQYL